MSGPACWQASRAGATAAGVLRHADIATTNRYVNQPVSDPARAASEAAGPREMRLPIEFAIRSGRKVLDLGLGLGR